jgi:hypothetical protein
MREVRAQIRELVEPETVVRSGAQQFHDDHARAHATPAGSGLRALGRQVVVDEDAADRDAVVAQPLPCDAEVDPVAGVVLDDVDRVVGAGGGPAGLEHLAVVR